MKLDKENTKQIIKIVVIAIVLLVALLNIEPVWNVCKTFLSILSPFICGLAIAFILNIFMRFYEEKLFKTKKKRKNNSKEITQSEKNNQSNNIMTKASNNVINKTNLEKENKQNKDNKNGKRVVSIALSIITIVAVVTIIMLLIIPQFVEIIKNLIINMPTYLESLKDWAIDLTQRVPEINNFIQNIQIDTEALKNGLMNISKGVLDVTINQVSGLVSGIVNFFIAIVFAVYILANKEGLKVQAKEFIYARIPEERADYILKVSRLARDSFRSFLTGQAKEAVILGVLCTLGMLILGIPYAGPVGALTALTAFIPIVGAFIGGFVGAVLIVAIDPIKALIFIIFIIVLQQIEGNLIYPHVVGKNIGLPSIWVLVAITIGGSLFGIMGMVIGLPILSIIYAIVTENTNKKLQEKGLKEEAIENK
jgi:predicted PurR-regulated permease PerM